MFNVGHNRSIDILLLLGIFPNYNAPVVRQAADDDRELVNMNWFRAAATRQGATTRHQRTRRQGHDRLLATLPGAGVSLLRAGRVREAGDMELIRVEGR
jgi:hypothetical protein